MLDIAHLFIFAIGLLGGFIGTAASGAGLITLPALLFLGIPPQVALATGRFGVLGQNVGSLIRFFREKMYVKELIFPMSVISVVGAALGARILLAFDQALLSKIVGVALLVFLPVLFLRHDIGIVQKHITRTKRWVAHALYFLAKVWGGFFSPGSGFLTLFVGVNAYGLTILQEKGTTRIPGVLGTGAAVIVFALGGVIDYGFGIALLIGMFIGGYIGSHVIIQKGNAWIKPIIAVFVVGIGLKMIFF